MPSFGRLGSLDALRGLAMLLMFLNHFTYFLLYNPSESTLFLSLFVVSRLAAPLFLFVSGFSLVYALGKRQASSGKLAAVKHSVSRGIVLILLGFVLSLMRLDPTWLNILYTFGLSLIVFPNLALKPDLGRCFISVCVLYALTQAALAYPPAHAVLNSFDFPPLPWSVFFVLGIASAGISLKRGIERCARVFELCAVASILLVTLLLSLGDTFEYQGICSPSFIAAMSTIIFLLLAVAVWVYEVYGKNPLFLAPLRVYGRHALLLYFTHHLLVMTFPKLAGLANTFNSEDTIASLILFLALSFLILKDRR